MGPHRSYNSITSYYSTWYVSSRTWPLAFVDVSELGNSDNQRSNPTWLLPTLAPLMVGKEMFPVKLNCSYPNFLHLHSITSKHRRWCPPLIPTDALERGTRRAAAAAAKARAESVRIRLGEDTPNSDAILGGAPEDEEGDVVAVFGEIVEVSSSLPLQISGDFSCHLVLMKMTVHKLTHVLITSVFVKDPYLVEVQDFCEDPRKIRDEVHR